MPYGLWDVQGKFVIPGTRKTASFGPIRIGDKDRQTASKHLAKMLNDKFSRDLRGDNKFSDHFALYNMQWKDWQSTPAPIHTTAPAQEQEVTP